MSYPEILRSIGLKEASKGKLIQHITKFIHASDIHLGSHQYDKSHRASDYIYAFNEILQLAIEHSVDFILLGGDVFNSLEMLPGKMTVIIETLMEFQKTTEKRIPIIAIEGNHDIRRYSRGVKFENRDQSWLKVCAKLGLIILLDADLQASSEHIFQPYDSKKVTGGKIQIKNIMVYGSRYLGEKPISCLSTIRKGIDKSKGVYNILLQHFGVEGQMKNVPGVSLNILNPLHHRVDYLALGHFHKQFILDDWIYNPGSAEAVSTLDYTYNRGIFLVEICGVEIFKKKVEILKLNNRRYLRTFILNPYTFKKKEAFYNYILKRLELTPEFTLLMKSKNTSRSPFLILTIRGIKPLSNNNVKQREFEKFLVQNLSIGGVKVYQKYNSNLITIKKYL